MPKRMPSSPDDRADLREIAKARPGQPIRRGSIFQAAADCQSDIAARSFCYDASLAGFAVIIGRCRDEAKP
jgi:hypothetical protein